MAGASVYTVQALLNWIRGTTMPAALTGCYLACFVGDPEAGGTEVSGNNYSRTSMQSALPAPTGSNKTISSNADIVTPIASGSWGTVDYIALYDASTSGNRIASGALSSSVAIASLDRLRIASGNLTLTGS